MDKSGVTYTVLWNAYKRMTEHLPLSQRRKYGHSEAFYCKPRIYFLQYRTQVGVSLYK